MTAAGAQPVQALPAHLKGFLIEGIVYPVPFALIIYESGGFEHPEVLGDGGLGGPDGLGDRIDAHRPFFEELDDVDPLVHREYLE